MKGDGIDLFDERLKREKDPKVRDKDDNSPRRRI
jgi:hypothetical protein